MAYVSTKRRRALAAASALLLVIGVAGCSNNNAQPEPTMTMGSIAEETPSLTSPLAASATASSSSTPLTSTSLPTSASPSPSAGTTTAQPPTSSKTSQPPPSTSSPSATESTSAALPAGLNAKQKVSAETALDVYRKYMSLIDKSAAQPGRDWSQQLAAVVVPPLQAQYLAILQGTAERGQRFTGKTLAYPKVTEVTPKGGEVTIKSCVDNRGVDFLGRDGKSIRVPDAKGAYRVHPQKVIVTGFGAQMLISLVDGDLDQRCTTG